jgi:hypothetical protein
VSKLADTSTTPSALAMGSDAEAWHGECSEIRPGALVPLRSTAERKVLADVL